MRELRNIIATMINQETCS